MSDQFWSARPVTLVRKQVHLSDCYDRTNEIQSETRGVHRGGHGGATGRCGASGHPKCGCFVSQRLYSFETPINTCWPAPRGLSWTFWLSNILFSWAHPLTLISLAWLPNQSEIEWSQVHVLVSLHLVGTWVFFCCGIFVSLGGCHHLDGLEQRRRSAMCWWLFVAGSDELVVRGCSGFPTERRIPTPVDCLCRNFSPFGRFL
jgi:hypothetical protein